MKRGILAVFASVLLCGCEPLPPDYRQPSDTLPTQFKRTWQVICSRRIVETEPHLYLIRDTRTGQCFRAYVNSVDPRTPGSEPGEDGRWYLVQSLGGTSCDPREHSTLCVKE